MRFVPPFIVVIPNNAIPNNSHITLPYNFTETYDKTILRILLRPEYQYVIIFKKKKDLFKR